MDTKNNTTRNKRIIIIVVVAVAIVISNLLGGIIGFKKGFEAGLYLQGLDSFSTIMNLKSLRQGRIEPAIHSLETRLDWQIYNISTYEQAHYCLYNLERYSKDIDLKKIQASLMKKVVGYRVEHPCEPRYDFEKDWCSPDNDFRKRINNTLKKYERQNETK